MKLTKDNYHSIEANQEYMSHSQYQDFIKCEEMAMAKLSGKYSEGNADALLIGSYVHAYFEGEAAMKEFKGSHPELFSSRGATKGELKSTYQIAEKMIDTLRNDALCMSVMQSDKNAQCYKEVIFRADFAGCTWRIMIDAYKPSAGYFADLKTTKSIVEGQWKQVEEFANEKYWLKVSFIEAYNYWMQMAIYSEIERIANNRASRLEPVIVAASKEDPPDKAVITMADDARLDDELIEIERKMPRILAVKAGNEPPRRCESCAYCRATKKLSKVITPDMLCVA